MPPTITLYSDYKSPYAYLAKQPAYDLATELGAHLDLLPYTLDIRTTWGAPRWARTAS